MSLSKRIFVASKLPFLIAAVCLVLSHGAAAQEVEVPDVAEESQITDMRREKILLSSWGQGSLLASDGADIPFYNFYISETYGVKANVGCAATALGQVMKHHNYPAFELPGFSAQCIITKQTLASPDIRDGVLSETNDVVSLSDPRNYSFADMQLNPTAADNPEFIATLLHDIAISLTSEFIVNVDAEGNDLGSPSETHPRDTKSDVKNIAAVLREKFSYSNAVVYAEWDTVRQSAFDDQEKMGRMICANLDARQPVVIVYGTGTTENHVAVVDGYGYVTGIESPFYHINFGMGGAADGWYQLPRFRPIQNAIPGSEFQCCYINAGSQQRLKAVIYNISPEVESEIISGRAGVEVVDQELSSDTNTVYKLSALDNTEIKIFDIADLYNEYAATVATNGIFALKTNFEGKTNVVIEAHCTDANNMPLVAEKRVDITKNGFDSKYQILTKDDIGNVFGVYLALEAPKAIVDGIGYVSLERAIAAAHLSPAALPEVKIVDEIDFGSLEWNIVRDMVISSTNSNPRLTPIKRTGSGFIRVHEGANVVFSNVCFQAVGDDFPAVEVSTNAVCTLAGVVDIDVIRVLDNGIIDITSAIDESCSFKVDTSDIAEGKPFARSARSASESDAAANQFVHLTDETLCGYAEDAPDASGAVIKWAVRPMLDSAAVLKLEQNGTSVNYRSFAKLLKDVVGPSSITVVKDCDFTNSFDVAYDMTISSLSAKRTVNSPRHLSQGSEGFTVKSGATLKFENVVFTGHDGRCFVIVEEDASFVLAEGAVLTNIVNRETEYGGAIDVKSNGSVKLHPEISVSGITNLCSSSKGGFMCLEPYAKAEIAGGVIEGCSALKGNGGAIYVAPNAILEVSGPASVFGNSETAQNTPSDIVLGHRSSLLKLTGTFDDGKFGVTLPTGKNLLGEQFATVEIVNATQDELRKTAMRFYNNKDAELYGSISDDGSFFKWAKDEVVVHAPLDEMFFDRAVARVVYPETCATQMWERLDWALNSLDADAEVTVISDNVEIGEKVYIANNVVLSSEGEAKSIISNTFDWRYDQIIGQDVYSHSIDIAKNASLTITNAIVKDTADKNGKVGPLFDVKGKLIFDDSSLVGGKRASGDIAINIFTSGEIVLTNNSSIVGYEGLYAVARSSGGAISVFDSSVISNKVSQGAAIVVGSDTVFTVGDNVSISGNTNIYQSVNTPANVQLNASRLVLSSSLDSEVCITPNYAGGAREDLFGVVGFDYGDDVKNFSFGASNFVNDVTSERGVVVTNNAGRAYLAWSGAINQSTSSFMVDGVAYYLVGEIPSMPPVYVPAEPVDIAFVSIVKNSEGTFWRLKLANAVAKCRYYLYQDDSLEDGFVIPADASGYIQSFTAAEDGEFVFEVPVTDKTQQFFKVLALPEAVAQ